MIDTKPMIDPDCNDGKHHNCDGTAWDWDTDQPTYCRCTCHGPAASTPA